MTSAQRTLSGMIMVGLLNMAGPLSFAASSSLPSTPEGSVVTGSLQTRSSEDAAWSNTQDSAKSHWFKTDAKSEAVISFAGDVHMRMAPGTVVHVESSSDAGLNVDVSQGDVMTTVPWSGKTPVHLTTPNGQVNSSSGSFIVKVSDDKVALEVLEGTARLTGQEVTSDQIPGVKLAEMDAEPGLLAEAQAEPGDSSDGGDKKNDDPNLNDDDEEEDNTAAYVVPPVVGGAVALALTQGKNNSRSSFGPPTPGSP